LRKKIGELQADLAARDRSFNVQLNTIAELRQTNNKLSRMLKKLTRDAGLTNFDTEESGDL
jgi:hypothetical protein